MSNSSKAIFNATLIITVLYIVGLPIFVIVTEQFKVVEQLQPIAASWITVTIASTGFYLLIKRFDAQQKINNQTIRKYGRDKIEQQLFKLLDLHSKAVTELRNSKSQIKKGSSVSYEPLVQKITLDLEVLILTYNCIISIDTTNVSWETLSKHQELTKGQIQQLDLYTKYLHINDRLREDRGSHLIGFIQLAIRSLNEDNSLKSTSPRNFLILSYQLLYYGNNAQNLKNIITLSDEATSSLLKQLANSLYIPSTGYQNEISPFFKTFYQAISFIDSISSKELSYPDKYKYVKMFRALLNTQELSLFFYNSLSSFGASWEDHESDNNTPPSLISKYNLLKNIPEGYCAYGLEPEVFFPDICYEGHNDSPEEKKAHFTKYYKLDKQQHP